MAARLTPTSVDPTPPNVKPGLWRRLAAWFGRLFRTMAWEARKRTGAEKADESRMMTGAQLMTAGGGIAVLGALGVIVMVGTAFDLARHQPAGLGSAIAGVIFYELVAAFGIWARELGAGRKARVDSTQIAARAVREGVDTAPATHTTRPWYKKKPVIIPLTLLPLLIPIGAYSLTVDPTTTAPNVVGMRLDAAHRKMADVDLLTYADGDVIGPGRAVINDHNWVVLTQSPATSTGVRQAIAESTELDRWSPSTTSSPSGTVNGGTHRKDRGLVWQSTLPVSNGRSSKM